MLLTVANILIPLTLTMSIQIYIAIEMDENAFKTGEEICIWVQQSWTARRKW
jgi:hypothetical protein